LKKESEKERKNKTKQQQLYPCKGRNKENVVNDES